MTLPLTEFVGTRECIEFGKPRLIAHSQDDLNLRFCAFSKALFRLMRLIYNLPVAGNERELSPESGLVSSVFLKLQKKSHIMGYMFNEKCLRTCAKCADLDHPAHAQSIIRAFALYPYFLMIPLADSEGLIRQRGYVRRLVFALSAQNDV